MKEELELIKQECDAILSSGAIQPMVEGPARRLRNLISLLEQAGVFQNLEQRLCCIETKLSLCMMKSKPAVS